MDNLIAWFRDYWPYAVVLVVVAVGASFIFRKAAKAYKDHQKRFHAEEAQMRRLVELKKTYYPLTELPPRRRRNCWKARRCQFRSRCRSRTIRSARLSFCRKRSS